MIQEGFPGYGVANYTPHGHGPERAGSGARREAGRGGGGGVEGVEMASARPWLAFAPFTNDLPGDVGGPGGVQEEGEGDVVAGVGGGGGGGGGGGVFEKAEECFRKMALQMNTLERQTSEMEGGEEGGGGGVDEGEGEDDSDAKMLREREWGG